MRDHICYAKPFTYVSRRICNGQPRWGCDDTLDVTGGSASRHPRLFVDNPAGVWNPTCVSNCFTAGVGNRPDLARVAESGKWMFMADNQVSIPSGRSPPFPSAHRRMVLSGGVAPDS